MDPILTNAHPGGLSFTIASFSNTGTNDIVTVKLLHSVNTALFYKTPLAGRTLSPLELATLRGYRWTQTELTMYGDSGSTFVGLTRAHLDSLYAQGRTTKLTTQNLYQWLSTIWPSLRSYFVQSSAKGLPYSISLVCPNAAPPALAVNLPDNITLDNPASIPRLQVHAPLDVPFSSVAVASGESPHITQAIATINYPTPGSRVTSGSSIMLIADPGLQASTTHKFTWFFTDAPAQVGIQVHATFTTTTSPLYVPLTLLVTNLATGVSDAALTYLIVDPS